MSIAAAVETTGFAYSSLADPGVSEEAILVGKRLDEAIEFGPHVWVGESIRSAQAALDAAYQGAQEDDWDGEGATAVSYATYIYACKFLRLLPTGTPLPEISADIDGEVIIEWNTGPRWVISVSVGRDGTLSYAALMGYRTRNGTEYLREALPVALSECIETLYNASLRGC